MKKINMKLLKIIAGFALLGVTATIVTPILVSCSDGSTNNNNGGVIDPPVEPSIPNVTDPITGWNPTGGKVMGITEKEYLKLRSNLLQFSKDDITGVLFKDMTVTLSTTRLDVTWEDMGTTCGFLINKHYAGEFWAKIGDKIVSTVLTNKQAIEGIWNLYP